MQSAVLASLFASAFAAPAVSFNPSQNLLINGDFEQTDYAAINGQCSMEKDGWCYIDASTIAPWYTSNGLQIEADRKPWPAASGSWSLDMNTDKPYDINQKVILAGDGAQYNLVFALSKNPFAGSPQIQVSVGSQDIPIVQNTYTGAGGWTEISMPFTVSAPGQQTLIVKFRSITGGNFGAAVDNVRLFQTSAPSYK